VPVAQSTSGTPTQPGRVADDSTEQALILGRPSTPTHRPSSTPGSSAQPPPAGQAQRHFAPTDVPSKSGLSTSAATQMRQDSHTGTSATPTGLLPANEAAAPLGSPHGQTASVSGYSRGAEAEPPSSEMQSSSAVGSLQDSSVHSPSQQQQTSDRLAQLHIPPLLDQSGAELLGRNFSSQAIGLQSAEAVSGNAADNRQQQSVASQRSNARVAQSAVPFAGSLREAAMQDSDVSAAPETMPGSNTQSVSQLPDTQLLSAQSSAGR
jgi:hypothetical protein